MKYIMAEADIGGMRRKVPLIFPSCLVHVVMANHFTNALAKQGYKNVQFVSAGDVNLFGAGLECSGHSETLSLVAQDGDARIIEMYDYLFGV